MINILAYLVLLGVLLYIARALYKIVRHLNVISFTAAEIHDQIVALQRGEIFDENLADFPVFGVPPEEPKGGNNDN